MKNLFFLLFAIAAFSSCTHTYHIPTGPNVPLFKEKNEVQAAASVGFDGSSSVKQGQAAYSITNRFAMAGAYLDYRGGDIPRNNYGIGQYAELSGGYYKPIRKHFVFEVFGGYAMCRQKHYYSENDYANLNFNKLFVRPSIGFTHSIIDVALTPSFSCVSFHDVSTNLSPNHREYLELDRMNKSKPIFLFEPAVTYRFGWKYVKLQTQWTRTVRLNHLDLDLERAHLSAGLSFAFAERMLKKDHPRNKPSDGAKKNN